MSLEVAIQENTAAIKDLVSVWSKLVLQGKQINAQVEAGEVTAVKAGPNTIQVATPKAAAPKVETPKSVPTPAAQETTPAPIESATEPLSEITYAEVSKTITSMVNVDRPRVVAVLAKFGAKNGQQLKPEQYAEFLEALK